MANFTGASFGDRGFGGGREPGRRGLPDNGRPATPSSSPMTSAPPSPPPPQPEAAAAATTTTTAPPPPPAAASGPLPPPPTTQPPPPPPQQRLRLRGPAPPRPPTTSPSPPPIRRRRRVDRRLRPTRDRLPTPSADPLALPLRPSQSPTPDRATTGPLPRPNTQNDDRRHRDLQPVAIQPNHFGKVKANNMKLNRVVLHGGLLPNDIITYHNGIRMLRIRVARIFTGSRILLQVYDPNNGGDLRGLMREGANGEFRNPREIVEALQRDFGTTFTATNRDATPWNALQVYRAGRRVGTLNEVRENIRLAGMQGVQQGGASNTTDGDAGTARGATETAGQATEPTGQATEPTGQATETTAQATEPTEEATDPTTPAPLPPLSRPINPEALASQIEAMHQILGPAPGERREREDEDEDEPEPPMKRARFERRDHGFH